jgi:hypothetical protein
MSSINDSISQCFQAKDGRSDSLESDRDHISLLTNDSASLYTDDGFIDQTILFEILALVESSVKNDGVDLLGIILAISDVLGDLASKYNSTLKDLTLLKIKYNEAIASSNQNSSNSSRSPSNDFLNRCGFPKTDDSDGSGDSNGSGGSTDSNAGEKSDSTELDPDEETPKRKIGAQKGHPRHTRSPMNVDDADEVFFLGEELEGQVCSKCQNGTLERAPERDKQVDYYDLPETLVKKIVSVFLAYRCPYCGKIHFSEEYTHQKPGS